MKLRWFWVAILVLPMVVTACTNETTLTFNNKTACGVATISLTNVDTGNVQQFKLDEGKNLNITIDHGTTYHYEITYAGRPDSDLNCQSKSGSVLVPKRGQNSTFTLIGVTPTPAP